MKSNRCAKSKLFSADPRFLQAVLDGIHRAFGPSVIISNIQPAKEGDWFAYVTWTEAAQR